MKTFEETALAYFRDEVGAGVIQRIDGIECFSPLPKFWFWRFRLNRMARKGLLTRRGIGSIWASCDGMPGYGIATPAPQPREAPPQSDALPSPQQRKDTR